MIIIGIWGEKIKIFSPQPEDKNATPTNNADAGAKATALIAGVVVPTNGTSYIYPHLVISLII